MLYRNNKGFTLIELMIAVAVVGILASIAFPSYEQHVRKGKRADGTGSLLRMAHNLERCGTSFGRYNHANCAALLVAQDSVDGHYSISGVATASTYTFTAAAQGKQADDSSYCDDFTVDQTGAKDASGSEGVQRCWNN